MYDLDYFQASAETRRANLVRRVADESKESLEEENKSLKAELYRLREELESARRSGPATSDTWTSNYANFSDDLSKTSSLIALSQIETRPSSIPEQADTNENPWLASFYKGVDLSSPESEPEEKSDVAHKAPVAPSSANILTWDNRSRSIADNQPIFASLDPTKSGTGFRATVLNADYIFPRSDNPLSLTPNIHVQALCHSYIVISR